jgi:hypothetical protein
MRTRRIVEYHSNTHVGRRCRCLRTNIPGNQNSRGRKGGRASGRTRHRAVEEFSRQSWEARNDCHTCEARHNQTARELAVRFGVSLRTILRTMAEERSEYLTRAQERRLRIRELRETGLSMRKIAAEVGCSAGTVHSALKDAPSA